MPITCKKAATFKAVALICGLGFAFYKLGDFEKEKRTYPALKNNNQRTTS
jgi:hypothetical protein